MSISEKVQIILSILSFIATLGSLVVLIFYTVYTKKIMIANQKASNIANNQLRESRHQMEQQKKQAALIQKQHIAINLFEIRMKFFKLYKYLFQTIRDFSVSKMDKSCCTHLAESINTIIGVEGIKPIGYLSTVEQIINEASIAFGEDKTKLISRLSNKYHGFVFLVHKKILDINIEIKKESKEISELLEVINKFDDKVIESIIQDLKDIL